MPDRPSLRKALDLKPGSTPALRLAGGQALTVELWNEAIDLDKAIERSAAAELLQQPRPRTEWITPARPRVPIRGWAP